MTLNTNELINILSQTPPAKKPAPLQAVTLITLLISVSVTVAILGMRANFGQTDIDILAALQKTVLLSAAFLYASITLRRISTPVQPKTTLLERIFLPVILLFILSTHLLFVPEKDIEISFILEKFFFCFTFVSIYGAAGLTALIYFMRKYAPANLQHAGIVSGFSAGAAAALGYSIHCPVDHPLYVIFAYGLPVLLLSVAGRFLLPKFVRW